ncbi:prolipoprotein diacylglyceryl transferase [Anaerotalea alkaliphila]|uniref:Phosphatidylglycerol--prolipoprotein diacylglyceryl transferase n=1 Tax=Anaerotalea alkaliphila TaxID=2662126 RepID=A0A7X5HT12_9FIRM|nr:prolipoprotein diacylglyceryl transferase [Anaerotalea alkaliphila]NDL66135.1 prolipoprotein diacylglyceryl transferase [Anaerotalea alkaliphila]
MLVAHAPDVVFPHLGIKIEKLDPAAFTLFGVEVYWYGIIIVLGILGGLLLAQYRAGKSGQSKELYADFLLYGLVAAILGARIYYVVFAWESYKDNLWDIFAFREGGLAIYGGVIGAVLALVLYTRVKKLDYWLMADTAAPGLLLGQSIGRWGNFFNMEAFGGYTDGPFAMALRVDALKYLPPSLVPHIQEMEGTAYIQVQPTFLYESAWSLLVVLLLLWYTRRKRFTGEIFWLYLLGYGLGRSVIEGFRTDQLFLWGTNIPASQLLAALLVVGSGIVLLVKRRGLKKAQ